VKEREQMEGLSIVWGWY